MYRKKTILIAVLINAGLLVLLFVLALHREEPTPKSVDMAQTVSPEPKPLFNDSQLLTDAPLAQTPGASDAIAGSQPNALPGLPNAPASNAEVVHQLPPLMTEEASAPIAAPSVPTASPLARALEVKVKKGDSLDKIAKAHHTSVDEIIRLNQLPSSFLRVGQTLKLPAERAAHAAKSSVGAKPMNNGQPEYYTVRVGDNPWTIAMKHHMKVDELLKVNNLTEEKARRLKPGDRLRVR